MTQTPILKTISLFFPPLCTLREWYRETGRQEAALASDNSREGHGCAKPACTWKLAGLGLVRQLQCPLAGIQSCVRGYYLLQHGLNNGHHHGCGGSIADPHGQEGRDKHKAQHQPAEEGAERKARVPVPHPRAQLGAGSHPSCQLKTRCANAGWLAGQLSSPPHPSSLPSFLSVTVDSHHQLDWIKEGLVRKYTSE